MSTASTRPAGLTLALTEEERELLLLFLDQALRNKLIEEHRTDALAFKELVRHQADLLQGIIDKLRRPDPTPRGTDDGRVAQSN
jgi:hypothetical protein